MGKPACIICGKERDGLEVRDDIIIKSLRWIKKNVTKSQKNYRLVVCKDCFLSYRKRRESYERKMMIYGAIGVIFLLALLVSAGGRLGAIGVGILIIIGLLLLAQFSYMPAVKMPDAPKSSGKGKRRGKN
ncbi:MAG: hypothetical protein KGI06_02480 [Candidatus Micrarchaeota archaeon]|nr:hypothetical protein [Candidatus Micrarchaeota archaeon]